MVTPALSIPHLGMGTTLRSPSEGDILVGNLVFGIRNGYRMIDTAWVYKTERLVGEAVRIACAEGHNRSDLFIQTKYYPQYPYGYDAVMSQFEESLNSLGLEYVDAYLIHQPIPRYAELEYKEMNRQAWNAMEELFHAGRVRAIGVSNFLERHIEWMTEDAEVQPMINQLEINPFFQQRGLCEWCRMRGMVVESWGPLAKGSAVSSEALKGISRKYSVSVGQLCLKWNIQMGNIPMVYSTSKENIRLNTQLDFDITEDDMEAIRLLNTSTNHRETWWYPRQQMY